MHRYFWRRDNIWDGSPTRIHVAPFYVYEFVDWSEFRCEAVNDRKTPILAQWKHADDYWFTKHALEHHSRVFKPEDAKMFIVPGYYNYIIQDPDRICCLPIKNVTVCGAHILIAIDELIARSVWFKKNAGRDHVIVTSHYRRDWRMTTLKSMNRITFEENFVRNERVGIASTYVGRKCNPIPLRNKSADVAMVAKLKTKFEFQTRRNICRWLTPNSTLKVSRCGQGKQCPALAQAKFGIHARGDTWGSNRLIDTLLSGTVPAFTDARQYDILPQFLPWRNMSVIIDSSNQNSFLQSIVDKLQSEYKLVSEYNRDKHVDKLVDWQEPFLFEHYMAAFTIFTHERIGQTQQRSFHSWLHRSS